MIEQLVCPVSRDSLVEVDRQGAFEALGDRVCRLAANRVTVSADELTEQSLLRSDGRGVYPLINGIPILMAPEMLVRPEGAEPIDTGQDPYREAYEEMNFYNTAATISHSNVLSSEAGEIVSRAVHAGSFPNSGWLDATYDIRSQTDAYAFLSPMKGMKVLQMGGMGIHAVKFLLAGARESWLVTPMLGEAIFASELAAAFGVKDRFIAVVGIAEELPFRDSTFNRIYSGGCIHHTVTERAFPEIKRVLRPEGKFAAIEPWRAPMYRIGIRVFGKQERDVNCKPLDMDRLLPLLRTFENPTVTHHGTFTRYFLIALGKLGVRAQMETIDRITRIDDKIASKISLRKYGSSVALLAESENGTSDTDSTPDCSRVNPGFPDFRSRPRGAS